MTVSIPESVVAEGNVKVVFVPVIADPAAPTVTELTAGTDLSCYMMSGWEGLTAEQNTGEDRRFCSTEVFQRLGRTSWTVSPLSYTYLPQGDDTGDANAVYDALAKDNTGFLVVGYGIDPAVDFAMANLVEVAPVKCGVQIKATTGEDEFAPLTVSQTLGVTGTVTQDAVVATA